MPTKTINSYSVNNNVVTVNTSTAHGMSQGTYFTIKGVNNQINGSYTVASVITGTQFTFSKTGLTNVGNVPSNGTLLYATIVDTGKPGYMYDEATDTWYLLSGKVDTGANYVWTGAHLFQAPVTFQDSIYQITSVVTSASAINVSGSASISGDLAVSGTTTLNNNTSVNGGLTLSGNLFLSNNTFLDGFKIFLGNSASPTPSASGGYIFVQNGALKYMGASGTITTIAPA
jgi:hypothetical protein